MKKILKYVLFLVFFTVFLLSCADKKITKYSGSNTFAGRNSNGGSAQKLSIELDIYSDTLVLIENGWSIGGKYHGTISFFVQKEESKEDTLIFSYLMSNRGATKYDSLYWFKATNDEMGLHCFFEKGSQVETFGLSKLSKRKFSGKLIDRYLYY